MQKSFISDPNKKKINLKLSMEHSIKKVRDAPQTFAALINIIKKH